MDPAQTVADEAWRVSAARATIAATQGAESTLSVLSSLACRLLDVPATQLSIVESDRQVVIARHSRHEEPGRRQVPLPQSVCRFIVQSGDTIAIEDSSAPDGGQEARAARAAGVCAYAGVPVADRAGNVLGAFCALEDQPRHWTDAELELLGQCAMIAQELLHALGVLDQAAGIDRLTGVLSTDMLEQLLDLAGHEPPVAVLAFGVDALQLLNDAHGHDAGDALLIGIADRLRSLVRDGDLVARDRGDVFLVALRNQHDPAEVDLIGRRLRAQLSDRPYDIGGHEQPMTLSVGRAIGGPGITVRCLVERARDALRAAKARSEDRQRHAPGDLADRARARLSLKGALQGAIGRGEMHLVYQPVVALRTSEIVGAEALLRWTHPVLGSVPPDDFIPVAERSGGIVELGDWVLDRACRDVSVWRGMTGWERFEVAINVAPLQLSVDDFARQVEETLARHGLPGRALLIEITERTLLRDSEHERDVLRRLHDQDVRIAVDDFGTGYSALSMLTKVPADILKLDRSFIVGSAADLRTDSVVNAVAGLAAGLRMRTVAEGIETAEQHAALLRAGFVFGQGYHFARPQPADELRRLLARSRQPDPPRDTPPVVV